MSKKIYSKILIIHRYQLETLISYRTIPNTGFVIEAADIVGDIIKWQKVFTNEGYAKLTVLVLTDTCFGYVCQNTAIVNDIKGTNTNYIVTESDIKNYLQKKLGLQLKL